MSDPVISIIICTQNRASDLRETLAALASVRVPDQMPSELIVVDNASTDETAQAVQQCHLPNMPVRSVCASTPGKGHAYNAGLAAAHGQVLLWTDDDVRPPPDWIAGMCGPILRGEADAVTGGVALAPHLMQPWMKTLHRACFASTDGAPADQPGPMIGANMAFAKSVLSQVPRFDTELGPGALGVEDDSLFSHQLEQAGYKLIRRADVEVEHHFRADRLQPDTFTRAAERWGRSQAYVAYHWYHEDVSFPRLRLAKCLLKQKAARLTPRGQKAAEDFPTEDAMALEKYIGFVRQYLTERKRPRNYDKLGLVKKGMACPLK